ncbi:MAG TPA: nucleotidyltransferase family protein [Bacteroidales bacterium]|nr:nucleotidyltransferase family protein [Bacteroidales bacterium]
MPPLTSIPPDVLRYRHRLSVQQINSLFGREVIEETLGEKAGALVKVAEFIRVTDLLRAASIDFIPLKGPLLSFRLYGDATTRRYGDIDILVDPLEVEKARVGLLAAGYNEYMVTWPESAMGKKKALRFWHHVSFQNPESEVVTELHWKLSNRQWLNFRNADRFVRENLCNVEFCGNKYQVLNPEAELLYLVIHGGIHRWGMLKWLVDIQRYLEISGFDNGKFCGLVKWFDCGRMVTLCNRMLEEYFPGTSLLPCGTQLPCYMERLAEETIEKPSSRGPGSISEILHLLPYSFIVYPGVKYKVKILGMIAGSSLFNGRLSRLFD